MEGPEEPHEAADDGKYLAAVLLERPTVWRCRTIRLFSLASLLHPLRPLQ